ncbi:hypothetical protein G7054_g13546 [Neopestalotiopsis clavispora]|nr:hypothetical protein G7054_g13546 [Neopestalotiopsis clavispora]
MSLPSQIVPPCPTFTEEHIPDLKGNVYLITGAATGIGLELAKMLYGKNATVYIATRSLTKIHSAIDSIRESWPNSSGRLEYILLDLSDLSSIKPAVDKFMSQEQQLNVLFHNAGVMNTPADSKSKQGHELMLATNAIGPFLLTELLKPVLLSTAKSCLSGSVRVVWVSSIIALGTPKGGIVWDKDIEAPKLHDSPSSNYMQSKAGVVYLSHEYAQDLGRHGIISVSLHPGFLKTELQRNFPAPLRALMGVVFKGPKAGAVTEIFAGFSPEVTMDRNGAYIIPWGRFGPLPDHVAAGLKSQEDGGNGMSVRFTKWCESVTTSFRV